MSLSAAERAAEERRLSRTLAEIERQLEAWQAVHQDRRRGVLATRGEMWEQLPSHVRSFDDVVEISQGLQELSRDERRLDEAQRRVDRLERLYLSPYFGRCDFRRADGGDRQVLYMGTASLIHEGTGEHLIYDWRAPIASLYYDFEPGPAQYEAPSGAVKGEVVTKRQFRIRRGRLEEVFDSSIHIADEVLQSILARSSGGQMRTIVQTIQRSQNRIIREEDARLLIVQGAAGSGKSSIALHRVAYLLYRHRRSLTSDNILVVSPNRLFSAYAANVLPELGEEPLNQTTFRDLTDRALRSHGLNLESRHQHMERLLAVQGPQDEDWLRMLAYKGSAAFMRLLQRYIARLEKGAWVAWRDLTYHGHTVMTAQAMQERFCAQYAYLPVERRAAKLKRRVFQELERLQAAGIGPSEGGGDGAPPAGLEAPGDGTTDLQLAPDEPGVDLEVIAIMEELDALLAMDLVSAYRRLFADEALFLALTRDEGVPLPQQLREATAAVLASGRIPYEDRAPMLLLHAALRGLPDMPGVHHVLIDEAQDYSLAEYAVMDRFFPNARFTVLGDRNQSIYPHTSIDDYDRLPDLFAVDEAVKVTLTRSYRSTQEIVAFSRALLRQGEPVEGVARSGSLPLLVRLTQEEEMADVAAVELSHLASQGRSSVAVIVRTLAQARQLAARLAERGTQVRCVTPDDDWIDGMVVMPCYVAKGLEFEAVVIPHAGIYEIEESLDRHLLYTACTRAMHDLRLLYEARPSWLAGLDKSLYRRRPS